MLRNTLLQSYLKRLVAGAPFAIAGSGPAVQEHPFCIQEFA